MFSVPASRITLAVRRVCKGKESHRSRILPKLHQSPVPISMILEHDYKNIFYDEILARPPVSIVRLFDLINTQKCLLLSNIMLTETRPYVVFLLLFIAVLFSKICPKLVPANRRSRDFVRGKRLVTGLKYAFCVAKLLDVYKNALFLF